jgi:hypothetical protein
MNIFVGTAGFSYKDWEGMVYPADLKKRKIHPLEYLAQFFDPVARSIPLFMATSGRTWEKAGARRRQP